MLAATAIPTRAAPGAPGPSPAERAQLRYTARMPSPDLPFEPPQHPDGRPADRVEMGGVVLEPGDRIGPYVYQRPLATGGMAIVLLARDPGGEPVALKVLKSHRLGTGLGRFRREFRALSRMAHENVIRVDAYGDIHGHPYIAMELVEGSDLHMEIRALRDLPPLERWAKVERLLIDLLRALAHIHGKGLVHRDLKPSNVLVTTEGRCKLTDFGIVKDLDPNNDPFVSTTLVGTWAYASPEQITGAPIDHRSDLYSLGVMLFAMLSGRRPFNARDMSGYIALHRDKAPPNLREIDPSIPPHLDAICVKLLAKAPRDRFQSAAEVLALLEQPTLEPVEPETGPGWVPPLFGRLVELDEVINAVSALTRGQGGLVLIEGEGGTGRSRLLQEALSQARLIGIAAWSARLGPQEGAFDALLRIASGIGRELGPRVPPELDAAVVRFVRGRGKVSGDLRFQLFDGIRGALVELLREGPVIIALDDLHHAPQPMVALISYLVRTLVVRDDAALLVIGTARSDLPALALSGLRDGTGLGMAPKRIELLPLSRDDVGGLVRAVLGSAGAAQADRLFQDTGGNPLYLSEYLDALRSGALSAPEAESEDATEVAGEMPARVKATILSRLADLSAAERAIVELVAASGRELDLDVLLGIIDESDDDAVIDRVERLVDRGILTERKVGVAAFVDMAHPRLGELVYHELPAPVRASLHRRLAAGLETLPAAGPLVAEVIGEHHRKAGDQAQAYRALGEAAHGLAERGLLAEATRIASTAQPLEEAGRAALPAEVFARTHLGLVEVRAQAAYNSGAWAEATALLRTLQSEAAALGDVRLAARAGLDLGSALRRSGEEAAAKLLVQGVLDAARGRHDRATIIDALHRLSAAAWEAGDLDAAEQLASQGLVQAAGPDLASSRAEILLALSAVQACRGQLTAAIAGLDEAEGLLARLRHKRAHAVVLGNLGELYTWQGRLGAALSKAEAGLVQAADVLFRDGEAFLLRVRGAALLEAGDLEAAARDLERSLVLCEELGIASDIVATRFVAARLHWLRGEPDRAVAHCQAGLRVARGQDPEAYTPALHALLALASASAGEADRAAEHLADLPLQDPRLPLPRRTQVQLLAGMAWATLGSEISARELLRMAARMSLSRGFRPWALESRIALLPLCEGQEAAAARAEALTLAAEIGESLDAQRHARWWSSPPLALLRTPIADT